MPRETVVIRRKPIRGLTGLLKAGIYCEPPINTLPAEQQTEFAYYSLHHPFMWKWTSPVARQKWGKADGIFDGEWRFSAYGFEAVQDGKPQAFLLWCDPKKAGKGSAFEFLSPLQSDLEDYAFAIVKWLHESHPDFKKGTSR